MINVNNSFLWIQSLPLKNRNIAVASARRGGKEKQRKRNLLGQGHLLVQGYSYSHHIPSVSLAGGKQQNPLYRSINELIYPRRVPCLPFILSKILTSEMQNYEA